MKRIDEIVTDAEIELVHAHANFGPEMTKRQVVDSGVLQYAFGYSTGHAQMTILLEHGLITKPRPGSYEARLTRKGSKYLRGMFAGIELKRIMELRAAR